VPDLHALAAIAGVYLAGLIVPGPNFIVIAGASVARGRNAGLWAAAGVVTVNILWAGASLAGMGLIFQRLPWLLTSLKLAGSAYLVWTGVAMIRSGLTKPLPGEPAEDVGASPFRSGMTTNLANGKAVVFYSSIFSAAAPQGASSLTLLCALLLVLAMGFLWYGAFALLLSRRGALRSIIGSRRVMGLAGGTVMIGLGAYLALR